MSKWSSAFRDSRWQKLRLEVMERDGWTCRSCGKKDGVTLNVHHAYYEAGKAPWEYPIETLVTYCEECHSARHYLQRMLLVNLYKTPTSVVYSIVYLIKLCPDVLEEMFSIIEYGHVTKSVMMEAVKSSMKAGKK